MKVLIINGPNLNMLGMREKEIYGAETLKDIELKIQKEAKKLSLQVEFFQSNFEGEIVEIIQKKYKNLDSIIINPAAFTHTSISIRDALLLTELPIVEVHLSNIYKREKFRHKSFIADIAVGQITGFGSYGYIMALQFLKNNLK